MRSLALTIVGFCLTGCSLYESAGRKFLEKNAYEFAGVTAMANQQSCQGERATAAWVQVNETSLAHVYVHDQGDNFEMRIVPSENNVEFSCDYQFASAQEMFDKTAAAIDLTLVQLHNLRQ